MTLGEVIQHLNWPIERVAATAGRTVGELRDFLLAEGLGSATPWGLLRPLVQTLETRGWVIEATDRGLVPTKRPDDEEVLRAIAIPADEVREMERPEMGFSWGIAVGQGAFRFARRELLVEIGEHHDKLTIEGQVLERRVGLRGRLTKRGQAWLAVSRRKEAVS